MIIEKTAINTNTNYSKLLFFKSARSAFKQILEHFNREDFTLLLPGYIGFSPNEGSGIYDPVVETGTKHLFYQMTSNLQIDIADFQNKIQEVKEKKIVLLVHYFGFVDKNIKQIIDICREHDAIVIEDEAHALYTDFIDHSCGNYGDFSIYSLHKMLPYADGGMLKVNSKEYASILFNESEAYNLFDYDLYSISLKRKNNANLWIDCLKGHEDKIEVLYDLEPNVTPQTIPVIIKTADRNALYGKLNEKGYGIVTLYHTMIKPIIDGEYEDAIWLSRHITNLPVHQDIKEAQIEAMCKELIELLSRDL